MFLTQLIEEIKKHGEGDIALVRKAYNFTKEIHKEQKRVSGEDYLVHLENTALTLAELGLDEKTIIDIANAADNIVTVEEGIVDGGFGSAVLELLNSKGINKPVKILGLPDKFIEHGKRAEMLDQCGLSPGKIASTF